MSRTQSTIRTTISVMVLLMTINGASAQSVDIESDGFDIVSDGADRIRIAGQLPTLSQQVAAASCAVTSDVDVEEAHDILEHATNQFDRYLVALRYGDEELHILHPEGNRRTLDDLEHVLTQWQAIRGARCLN